MADKVNAKIVCEKIGHRYGEVWDVVSKTNVNYCGRCGHIAPITESFGPFWDDSRPTKEE